MLVGCGRLRRLRLCGESERELLRKTRSAYGVQVDYAVRKSSSAYNEIGQGRADFGLRGRASFMFCVIDRRRDLSERLH